LALVATGDACGYVVLGAIMEEERFSRIELLIGHEGLERLRSAHCAVVGLGAVWGYAAEALARSGVGRLRLVDFDVVRRSNRNRQLYALDSTLGLPKVDVACRRVADINPDCEVEALREFVHVETLDLVLAGPPDMVIDAIDSFTQKVALLAAATARGIPVVSSMGAALRTDPSCVRVGPLHETSQCPLAKRVRKRLRQLGASLDFPCVYSVEPVPPERCGAADVDDCGEKELYPRGRERRPFGSLPTLTGIFGLTAANAALKTLLGDRLPS
jgi:tRNA A37 threonylcarbamoyladenosine dehydratase